MSDRPMTDEQTERDHEDRITAAEGRIQELEDTPSGGGGGPAFGENDAPVSRAQQHADAIYLGHQGWTGGSSISRDANWPVYPIEFQLRDENGDEIGDPEPGLAFVLAAQSRWVYVRRAAVSAIDQNPNLNVYEAGYLGDDLPGDVPNVDDLTCLLSHDTPYPEGVFVDKPISVEESDWGYGAEPTFITAVAPSQVFARPLHVIIGVIGPEFTPSGNTLDDPPLEDPGF